MGYWYHISDANVHIPKENLAVLYTKCVKIATDRAEAYGITAEMIPNNLTDVLGENGIRFDYDEKTGELHLWGGDSKYHSTFPFTEAMLSVAPDQSYIIWQGEEGGDLMRQIVIDGEVRLQHGVITFAG
jgi:hypothetical protein